LKACQNRGLARSLTPSNEDFRRTAVRERLEKACKSVLSRPRRTKKSENPGKNPTKSRRRL
jgi:hypothetical protein